MKKELAEALVIRRKIVALNYAKGLGNVKMACRELGVSRASFYRWRKAYEKDGIEGLIRKKPVARSHPRQIPPEYVEKILHLRKKYHLGPQRIAWYLERYHDFKTSCSSVYRTLKRNGIGPLPRNVGRRAIHTRRYAKQVPGHQIQVDVKFLTLKIGRWAQEQEVSIHGHRRRDTGSSIEDLPKTQPEEFNRLH